MVGPVLSLFLLLPYSQSHSAAPAPRLDMHATKRLLREAEKDLARFRLTQPRTQRFNPDDARWRLVLSGVPGASRSFFRATPTRARDIVGNRPSLVESRGSPLVGRYLEFVCKYVTTTSLTDAVSQRFDHETFGPTQSLDANKDLAGNIIIVHGSIQGQFKVSDYPIEVMIPGAIEALAARVEQSKSGVVAGGAKKGGRVARINPKPQRRANETLSAWEARKKKTAKQLKGIVDQALNAKAQLIKDHRDTIRGITHELRLQLPAGFRPPHRPFKRFKAEVRVLSVQFDRSANLPHFIIHAQLIKSKKLNLTATGILDQSRVR